MQTTKTLGIHHVGLTVRDLDEVEQFFVDILGWQIKGRIESYPAVFLTDGLVTLTFWKAINPEKAIAFDRKNNVGLHHLALKINDLNSLEILYTQVNKLPNVMMEFSPQPMSEGSSRSHFICAIPGGLRIEFATS